MGPQDRRYPRLVPWFHNLLRRYLHLPWHVLRHVRFPQAHPLGRQQVLALVLPLGLGCDHRLRLHVHDEGRWCQRPPWCCWRWCLGWFRQVQGDLHRLQSGSIRITMTRRLFQNHDYAFFYYNYSAKKKTSNERRRKNESNYKRITFSPYIYY